MLKKKAKINELNPLNAGTPWEWFIPMLPPFMIVDCIQISFVSNEALNRENIRTLKSVFLGNVANDSSEELYGGVSGN